MGWIEDLAAEMRTAGLTLDDHMLYTIFIDALPAEYEVEVKNLASRDKIGSDGIIKTAYERNHWLSGNRKKGCNAGLAVHATFASESGGGDGRGKGGGGGGGCGKGGDDGGHGKGGRRGQQGRGGKGTNEDGGGSAAAAGGGGGSAKAAEGSTPEAGCYRCGKWSRWKADYTEERCSRCQGQEHTADVCQRPRSSNEAVATDGVTPLISARRGKKTLCWRCRW